MENTKTDRKRWILYIRQYLTTELMSGVPTSSPDFKRCYSRYMTRCMRHNPESYEEFKNNIVNFKSAYHVVKPYVDEYHIDLYEGSGSMMSWKSYVDSSITMYTDWKRRHDLITNGNTTRRRGREYNMEVTPFPYLATFACRCLKGIYPIELFPVEMEPYREELERFLQKDEYKLKRYSY